jgi:hypothetical protein
MTNYENITNLEVENIYHSIVDKIKEDKVISSNKQSNYNIILHNFLKAHIIKKTDKIIYETNNNSDTE